MIKIQPEDGKQADKIIDILKDKQPKGPDMSHLMLKLRQYVKKDIDFYNDMMQDEKRQ